MFIRGLESPRAWRGEEWGSHHAFCDQAAGSRHALRGEGPESLHAVHGGGLGSLRAPRDREAEFPHDCYVLWWSFRFAEIGQPGPVPRRAWRALSASGRSIRGVARSYQELRALTVDGRRGHARNQDGHEDRKCGVGGNLHCVLECSGCGESLTMLAILTDLLIGCAPP